MKEKIKENKRELIDLRVEMEELKEDRLPDLPFLQYFIAITIMKFIYSQFIVMIVTTLLIVYFAVKYLMDKITDKRIDEIKNRIVEIEKENIELED